VDRVVSSLPYQADKRGFCLSRFATPPTASALLEDGIRRAVEPVVRALAREER
jgi:hypothetical protein